MNPCCKCGRPTPSAQPFCIHCGTKQAKGPSLPKWAKTPGCLTRGILIGVVFFIIVSIIGAIRGGINPTYLPAQPTGQTTTTPTVPVVHSDLLWTGNAWGTDGSFQCSMTLQLESPLSRPDSSSQAHYHCESNGSVWADSRVKVQVTGETVIWTSVSGGTTAVFSGTFKSSTHIEGTYTLDGANNGTWVLDK